MLTWVTRAMRKVVGALAVPVENNVIAQPHLPTPPNNYGLLTNLAVAELVISAVCEKSKIDEAEFWKAVR